MRHSNSGRKFDRNSSHRRAMLRNLTANLILHERIETTDAKAKELRRSAERLITKARRLGAIAYTAQDQLSAGDKARRLNASRVINAYIPRFVVRIEKGGEAKQVDLVEKVLIELGKRFAERQGGYTRIIKMGPRRGDGAPMVLIEFVGEAAKAQDEKPKKAKKSKKPEDAAAAKAE